MQLPRLKPTFHSFKGNYYYRLTLWCWLEGLGKVGPHLTHPPPGKVIALKPGVKGVLVSVVEQVAHIISVGNTEVKAIGY